MRLTLILALAGALVLAGCNSAPDDENARDANVTDVPEAAPTDTIRLNQAEGPANADAPANEVTAPQISDEQQIQDDADASGMTSRLSDENEAPSSARASAANDHTSADHGLGNTSVER